MTKIILKRYYHIKCPIKDGYLNSLKYLGAWAIKTKYGWSEYPVDVFYNANPDVGHSNYLGIFWDQVKQAFMLTDASSAFDNALSCLVKDDIIYVSKFRHDYVCTPKGLFIDGGRDYLRTNCLELKKLSVVNGDFVLLDNNEKITIEYE